MDFAREHDRDRLTRDEPRLTVGGGSAPWAPFFVASTDTPLEIIPGCGPPPPEFRTMMVDGEPTLVLVEMRCASPGDAGVFGLCGESRAPRPCYRSIWDVYGLRRRPRISRGRRR